MKRGLAGTALVFAFLALPLSLVLFNLARVGLSRSASLDLFEEAILSSEALATGLRRHAAALVKQRGEVGPDEVMKIFDFSEERMRALVDELAPPEMRHAPLAEFWNNCFDWLDSDAAMIEITATTDPIEQRLDGIVATTEPLTLEHQLARKAREVVRDLPSREALTRDLNRKQEDLAFAKRILGGVRIGFNTVWLLPVLVIVLLGCFGPGSNRWRARFVGWGLVIVGAAIAISAAVVRIVFNGEKLLTMGGGAPPPELVLHLGGRFLDLGVSGQTTLALIEAVLLLAIGGVSVVMVGGAVARPSNGGPA